MNDIIPFDFNNHTVRVIDDNGELWFVAMDVAEVLGYSDAHKMTSRLDEDEKSNRQIGGLGSPTGGRGTTLINEAGLYACVLTSQKPDAKAFKRWVTHEVLPAIRKTGQYTAPAAIPDFSDPAAAARAWADQYEARLLAERTKAEIGSRREATAMATASAATRRAGRLEVELDQSRQYCTIKRMSMLCHGQPFDWRVLKAVSKALRLPPKDVFDANYGSVKAYHASAWREAYAIDLDEVTA